VFQYGSHQLFSCSCDRTVKLWNVDEMAYIETLFGHQDGVMGIDCLSQERPVTAGASDRSVRIWKIIEESQLVYNDHR
jgi:ribosomal RNA-processing protein 9